MRNSFASHIENYINNEYKQTDSFKETTRKVLEYFSKLGHSELVIFHIAGYEKEDSKDVFRMYRVVTLANKCLYPSTMCANPSGMAKQKSSLESSKIGFFPKMKF